VATIAARMTASTTPGPATPAVIPMLTKIPVPRIEPNPMRTAPGTPTTRARVPLGVVDGPLMTLTPAVGDVASNNLASPRNGRDRDLRSVGAPCLGE